MSDSKNPAVLATRRGFPIVQLGGEREEPSANAHPAQVPIPGYADKAQLAKAALRNAVAAGRLGGRQGLALLRLAEALQSRAIGQEVRCA